MSKHLTMKDRVQLQYMIEDERKLTLAQVSMKLDVATSTIFRELKNKRVILSNNASFGSTKVLDSNAH